MTEANKPLEGDTTRATREHAEHALTKGSPQSALSPERILAAQGKAEAKNAKADRSFDAEGKAMAKAYLAGIAGATGTWLTAVVHLIKTANNLQRERAMKAATEYLEAEGDETAVMSLKKRISETRRVFKACDAAYDETLKLMEGKGTWSAKVGKLPKGNVGRPKGTASTETTGTTPAAGTVPGSDQGDAMKANLAAADFKAGKVKAVAVGLVLQMIDQQSPENLLKILDKVTFKLFSLPKAPDGKTDKFLMLRSLGQSVMKLRDVQDKQQIQAEAREASTGGNE